ncbi:DUF4919 domain-containing protein [Chryseobacterium sp. MYb328]|uniref:DUF4919 domain-containing protein n=1 Tax=Chryseobacterium sp. MYb328 TaxID=2745231 RepID=UPI0030B48783
MRALILFIFFPLLILAQNKFEYKKDFDNILKETKNKKSDLYYDHLLKRYHKLDSTLTDKQVLALLIGFTDNKFYKPYKDIQFGRNLYQMNDDKQYNEVIQLGDEFLKDHPFDLKTLFETSYAYFKTDRKIIADQYLVKTKMIFRAMAYSGLGMDENNPTFALNPTDGQDFLKKGFSMKIGKMGSGRDKNGDFLDILDIVLENGNTKSMYFIIPHATKKMFE